MWFWGWRFPFFSIKCFIFSSSFLFLALCFFSFLCSPQPFPLSLTLRLYFLFISFPLLPLPLLFLFMSFLSSNISSHPLFSLSSVPFSLSFPLSSPHRMCQTHVISLPGLSGSFSPSLGEPTKGCSIVAYLKSYSPHASQPWLFWTLNYCLTPSHLHPEHYITVSQTPLPAPPCTHMTSYWCVCVCVCTAMYVCGGMCLYICVYVCAQTSVFVPVTLCVHLWQVPSWLLLCLQTCLGVVVNPDGGCAQIPWVFWN